MASEKYSVRFVSVVTPVFNEEEVIGLNNEEK